MRRKFQGHGNCEGWRQDQENLNVGEGNIMKRRELFIYWCVLVAAFLVYMPVGSEAYAATYYIAPSGSDSSGNGTSGNPWKTLDKAFSSGSGGDTYVLKNGTYNYSGAEFDGSIDSGSSGAYTIIRAENDGGAVITQSGGLYLPASVSYVQIEGIKWNSSGQKYIGGHHIKFFRCAFQGGPSSGNVVNTGVGSNSDNARYILFEDCWWFGLGGRYNLLIYNSDYVVIRRAIIRHDGGWGPASGNPESGITFYESSNIHAQNVIVIDSNEAYEYWSGSFYAVQNGVTGHPTSNNSWTGCIALVGGHVGFSVEDDTSNSTFTDVVAVDTINGAMAFGGPNSCTVTLNRATLLRKKLAYSGDWKGGIGTWGSGTKTITNVIAANFPAADFVGVSPTYFDTYNNSTSTNGTGRQTYNPETNGLLHLTRIEDGSNLKANGSGGGQIGAQIVNRIGTGGTLYGDSGWNSDTGQPLWPWPNEDRIKTDMASVSTRGFCATGMTITKYIWEYLGNPTPTDIGGGGGGGAKTPMAPSGLSVQ